MTCRLANILWLNVPAYSFNQNVEPCSMLFTSGIEDRLTLSHLVGRSIIHRYSAPEKRFGNPGRLIDDALQDDAKLLIFLKFPDDYAENTCVFSSKWTGLYQKTTFDSATQAPPFRGERCDSPERLIKVIDLKRAYFSTTNGGHLLYFLS